MQYNPIGTVLPVGGIVKRIFLFAVGAAVGLTSVVQVKAEVTTVAVPVTVTTTYRVVVTSRSVQAVNYRHRSGATDVDFAGTALLPSGCSVLMCEE